MPAVMAETVSTNQFRNGMHIELDGSVWRIDVGLAKYYGDSPISVLEVKAGRVGVLTAPR